MNQITYTRHGNYYLADLIPPEQNDVFIGKYGLLRKSYLKTHRRVIYINLLTSGNLLEHLTETDKQAQDRLETLIKQIAEVQGITESLKAADQMAWVGAMNNIRQQAEEIIYKELIYA